MSPRSGRDLVPILCLLLGTLAALAPCLENGFTSWDDDLYVTQNPNVQRLDAQSLGRIFGDFLLGNYHPVVLFSYALDHRLFGLDPKGFHATNLLLHAINLLLVYLLIRRLGSGCVAAFVGAGLFALHPMRVEAVAWVAGRKDLLAAAFALASVLTYLGFLRNGGGRRYLAALGLFVLACGAKGTSAVLPAALAFLHWREPRADRRHLRSLIPFVLVGLLFGVLALEARRSYEPVLQEGRFGWIPMLHLAAHRFVFYYLARFLLPWTSSVHLYPPMGPHGEAIPPGFWLSLLGALLCAALLGLLIWKARSLAFGGVLFLVALLPALPLPNLGYSADRFSYLPSVGLSLLIGAAVTVWVERRRGGSRRQAVALWIPPLVLLGLLGVASAQRCSVWRNSITLWSDAIRNYPPTSDLKRNRAMAHAYRAEAYASQGDLAQAAADFNEAIRIDDTVTDAWFGRAVIWERLGRPEETLADLKEVLKREPDHREALLRAARLHYERGEFRAARHHAERAEALGARVDPVVMEFLRSVVPGATAP